MHVVVLNLVINGLPSIRKKLGWDIELNDAHVLNLVINGLPSIQNLRGNYNEIIKQSFKPCYKWITFNTDEAREIISSNPEFISVLNLVINGLPSIRLNTIELGANSGVLNLVINGLPSILN